MQVNINGLEVELERPKEPAEQQHEAALPCYCFCFECICPTLQAKTNVCV